MTTAPRPGYDGPHGSIVARSVGLGLLVGTTAGLLMGLAASWDALEYAPLTAIFGTLAGVIGGGLVGLGLAPLARRLALARTGRPTTAELVAVGSFPVSLVLAVTVYFSGGAWSLLLLGLGALSVSLVVGAVVTLLPWVWAPLRSSAPARATP
ncbi:hypothetical protein [Sanguibacter massiliensis]|uniref:hypothetical protein n=1 Tax=Sanguibacter massiliensis TaxID=1973217 RepID=UPI000C84172A|nr:hypothetical protein [Sanguibacter massiliensis]